jgi:hypothetical protein
MADGAMKLDAVRSARERLGAVSSREMADYIEAEFGIRLQPAIVSVLLGTLAEREHLAALRQRGREAG